MSHSRLLSILTLAAGLAVACDAPKPGDGTPAPPQGADTVASSAPTPAPYDSTFYERTASGDPSPPISTDGWASLSTANKSLTLRYPKNVFPRTKVAAESLTLLSDLTAEGLGEEPGEPWRYQIHVEYLAGTPFDAMKQLFARYPFPQMFPSGTEDSYVEYGPYGWRALVAGHAGYSIYEGIEGYNTATMILAVQPQRTLLVRCTYIGSVISLGDRALPQEQICDAVLASIFAAGP